MTLRRRQQRPFRRRTTGHRSGDAVWPVPRRDGQEAPHPKAETSKVGPGTAGRQREPRVQTCRAAGLGHSHWGWAERGAERGARPGASSQGHQERPGP